MFDGLSKANISNLTTRPARSGILQIVKCDFYVHRAAVTCNGQYRMLGVKQIFDLKIPSKDLQDIMATSISLNTKKCPELLR